MIKFTKTIIIQALDCTLAPTIIVDARKPGLPVTYVNPAAEVLTGKSAEEVVGLPFADIQAAGHLPAEIGNVDAESLEQVGRTDQHKWHTRDGISVMLNVRVSPLHDNVGRLGFWMFSVVDETPSTTLRGEVVDAKRQIRNLQRTDPVTGLANLTTFDEVLERDWLIARRDQRRVGIIVFSIDCLAEYREIFGRHAADSLLKKVGHAISGTVRRAGDFGARIAGDQFAVLIGDANESQAEACASRIAAKVRSLAIHHPRSTVARFATVSYGAATELPAWTKESVTLLEEAGRRLDSNRQTAEAAAAQSPSADEEVVT